MQKCMDVLVNTRFEIPYPDQECYARGRKCRANNQECDIDYQKFYTQKIRNVITISERSFLSWHLPDGCNKNTEKIV